MSYFTLHQQSTIIGWWLIYCVLFLLKLTIHILNYKFQLDFDNQVNRTPAIEYVGYYIMVHFDIKANLFLVSEKAHWSFPEKLIVPPMLRISFCFKSWSPLDFQSILSWPYGISIFFALTSLEIHVFSSNFGISPWNSNYFYFYSIDILNRGGG